MARARKTSTARIMAVSIAVSWMICAFVSAEPNVFSWSEDGRLICVILSAIIMGAWAAIQSDGAA